MTKRLGWSADQIVFEDEPIDKAKYKEDQHPRDDEGKFEKKDDAGGDATWNYWKDKIPTGPLSDMPHQPTEQPKKKWNQVKPPKHEHAEQQPLFKNPPKTQGDYSYTGPKKEVDPNAPPPEKKVYKPHAIPELGVIFRKDKPDASITGLNGIPFTEPKPEFWKEKNYEPFPSESPEIPKVEFEVEQEYTYKDKETGETKTKTKKYMHRLEPASGAILQEEDGSIWIVEPDKHFGGYETTFPKGKVEKDLTPQQNALKEIYEETGLEAELTGYLYDVEGDTSITRYYLGKRVGGNPYKSHWETYSVRLTTLDEAEKLLNRSRDQKTLKMLRFMLQSKSAVDGNVSSAPIPAVNEYLSSNLDVPDLDSPEYDITNEGDAQPTLLIEIVPVALYYGQIVRFERLRDTLYNTADPNVIAMRMVKEAYGTGYVELMTWRPSDELSTLTYVVLLDVPADAVPKPHFIVTQLTAINVGELDENGLAVDCIERVAEQALVNDAYRSRLPAGWFEALKSFLPQAGREL